MGSLAVLALRFSPFLLLNPVPREEWTRHEKNENKNNVKTSVERISKKSAVEAVEDVEGAVERNGKGISDKKK